MEGGQWTVYELGVRVETTQYKLWGVTIEAE